MEKLLEIRKDGYNINKLLNYEFPLRGMSFTITEMLIEFVSQIFQGLLL
jgi:hypothetical protein